MKLSKEYKIKIEQEFDFVIKKMLESENPDQMMYYFSGIYGLLQRILNFEYSDELLFTYFIIERSCKDIANQLSALRQGSPVPTFHKNFGSKLIEVTKELRDSFFNSKHRVESLKKLIVLAYTCTGNGFYLTEKNTIEIFAVTKKLEGKD
ncbi:MAG: hypothetical protein GXP56_13490 [Deltaproteobacteria bacterium]|nr:hypothetical protein [Deltaproteobacteria bacterium]